jgi:hypothetical protein
VQHTLELVGHTLVGHTLVGHTLVGHTLVPHKEPEQHKQERDVDAWVPLGLLVLLGPWL